MADSTPVLGQDPIVPNEINTQGQSDGVLDTSIKGKVSRISKALQPSSDKSVGNLVLPDNISRSQFQKRLGTDADVEGYDIAESVAQAQSAGERMAYLPFRAAVKALKEVATIPGYLYGAGRWTLEGFDPEEYGKSFNNAWNASLQDINDNLNQNGLPVYTPESVRDGNMWDKLASASFWATEGADGAGFLIGMMAPGYILRTAKFGEAMAGTGKAIRNFTTAEKLGKPAYEIAEKLAKSQKTAGLINDYTAALVNTGFEAGVEGVDTFNGYMDNHPGDAIGAGRAASKTFLANVAILTGPNLLNQKWLFGGLKRSKIVETAIGKSAMEESMGKVIDKATNAVVDVMKPASALRKTGRIARGLATGVASEGLWEEGMQYVVSERAKKGESALNIREDVKDWYENVTAGAENTNFWSGVVLGGIMGGGMSTFGNIKSQGRIDNTISSWHNLLKNNSLNYLKTLKDFAVTVDGKPQYNKNGSPRLDPQKVLAGAEQIFTNASIRDKAIRAIKAGDVEAADQALELIHFNYMLPWLKIEGGKELLTKHINYLAKQEADQLEKETGVKGSSVTETEKGLIAKMNKFSKLYEQINDTHDINFNVKYDKKNKEKFVEFREAIKNGKLTAKLQLKYAEDRINSLKDDLSNHEKGSVVSEGNKIDDNLETSLHTSYKEMSKTSNLDKTDQIEIEKKIKDIGKFVKAYKAAETALNEMYDGKKLQEAFNGMIKESEALNSQENATEASKDILDPDLRAIHEQYVKTEDLSTEGSQIQVNSPEGVLNIPARNIKETHRGIVKIKYDAPLLDKDNKPVLKDGLPQRGDREQLFVVMDRNASTNGLNLIPVVKTKDGKYEKSQQRGQAVLLDKNTILYRNHKYKISNISEEQSSDKAKETTRYNTAFNVYTDAINTYNKFHKEFVETIKASNLKIKEYNKIIKDFLKAHRNDLYTEKGSEKKIYIGSKKEAGRIVRIYKTVSELRDEVARLEENRDKLKIREPLRTARKNEYKAKLDAVKAGDEVSVESLQAAYNTILKEEQEALGMWRLAKNAAATARATIRNANLAIKGWPNMLAKQLKINIDEEHLGITNLPEEEKVAIQVAIVLDALRLMNPITDNDPEIDGTISSVVEGHESIDDKLTRLEGILKEAETLEQEYAKIWNELKTKVALAGRERTRFFQEYKRQASRYGKIVDFTDESLFPKYVDKHNVEDKFKDISADERDSFEKQPRHPFQDWTSFLHLTSNQDEAANDENVARFYVYVNNFAYRNLSEKKFVFKTYTYSQFLAKFGKSPIHMRSVKFYVPSEKDNKTTHGMYTVEELGKLGPSKIAEAENDVKAVLSHKNGMPVLSTAKGNIVESKDNKESRQFLVYSSLPLESEVRDSGYSRFSFKNIEDRYISEKVAEGAARSEQLNLDATNHAIAIFEAEQQKYVKFREELGTESKVLYTTSVNPGKKVTDGIPRQFPDVADAVIDDVNEYMFHVSTPFRKDNGDPTDSDITVSGKKWKARSGFAYIYYKNRLEPIIPKTLGQTGSVDSIINLLRYAASDKDGAANAYAYVAQIIYMTSYNQFGHRISFIEATEKDKVKSKYKLLVFGDSTISIEELVAGKNLNELREFLSDKYWNIDDKAIKSNKDFTEYSVKEVGGELIISDKVWKKEDGGYKEFLLGKGHSKFVMEVRPPEKGKDKYYLAAKKPQFISQSLNLSLKELKDEELDKSATDNALPEEVTEVGRLVKIDLTNESGGISTFHIVYYPKSKKYTLEHDELKDLKVPKEGNTFKAIIGMMKDGTLTDKSGDTQIPNFTEGITVQITSKNLKQADKAEPGLGKTSGLSEAAPVTSGIVESKPLTGSALLDLYRERKAYDKLESDAKEMLESEGIDITNDNLAKRMQEMAEAEQSIANDDNTFDRKERQVSVGGENIPAAMAWFKQHFPEFPASVVEGLIDGNSWGRLVRGTEMLLSSVAEIGTVYHEAFHVWNNIYNSGKSRQELYTEVRKRLGNNDMTDREAEEFLAEEFRDYVMQGSAYVFNKGQEAKKSFFTWLLNQIEKFFGVFGINVKRGGNIEEVFKNINEGTFTTPLSSTNKTFDKKAVKSLSPSDNLNITKNVNYRFFKYITNDLDNLFSVTDDATAIYKKVEVSYAISRDKALKDGRNTDAAKFKVILDNWESIKKAHALMLTQFKIDVRDEIEEDDISSRNNREQKYSNTRPLKDWAPEPIRLLVAALPSDTTKKKPTTTSEYRMMMNADYNVIMNTLFNQLSRVTTINGMMDKILSLSEKKSELLQLYKWLGGEKSDKTTLTDTEFRLVAQFYHTFSANRNKPFTMVVDNDGIFTQNILTDESEKRVMQRGWIENAISMANKKTSRYIIYKNNNYIIDVDKLSKDLSTYSKDKTAKAILENLGINIPVDGLGQYDEVTYYLSSLKQQLELLKGKDIVIDINSLYNRNIFKNQNRMDALTEFASEFILNDSDLMYFNHNGDLEWSVSRNSHISEVTNRLNELSLQKKVGLTDQIPESLESIMPFDGEKGNLFNLHSDWFKAIASGDYTIEFFLIKGITDKSTSNGVELDKTPPPDLKSVSFDAVLRGVVPLMSAADRGPEYGFRLKPRRGAEKSNTVDYNIGIDGFKAKMYDYLYDEVITSIAVHLGLEQFGAGLKNYGENAKKLRTFGFLHDIRIADGEYIDTVGSFVSEIINPSTDFASLQKYTQDYIDNNKDSIDIVFGNFIQDMIANNKSSLEESKLIKRNGERWDAAGINTQLVKDEFTGVSFDASGRLTDADLNTILLVHAYNYFVGTQEQLKLFIGDMASYDSAAGLHKRITSSASTRQQSLNDAESIKVLNEKIPKINGESHSNTISKLIVNEIHDNRRDNGEDHYLSYISPAYNKSAISDGQKRSTMDFIKGIHYRNGNWSDAQEMTYQYEMQKMALRLLKDQSSKSPKYGDLFTINPEAFTKKGGFFYEHTNGTIPTEPMFRGKKINLVDLGQIPPIKPLGAGYIKGVNIAAMDIDKQSTSALFPSTLGENEFKLYLYMLKHNIDKIGDSTTEKADYFVNEIDLKSGILPDAPILTMTSYDDYGIQLEIQDEFKDKVTDSTQKISVIYNNTKNNGVILDEFKDLEPDIKEHADILNLQYDRAMKDVIDELGLEIQNGRYVLPDKNVQQFTEKLEQAFIKRAMPLNTIDGLELWIKSKSKVLDLFTESAKINQVLTSMTKNNVIKRKVSGEMLVQESSYLYDTDLKFYRMENGKVLPMEVMIPIPVSWLPWVENIGGIDALNKRLDKGLLPDELITFLANRIPTADINTIEVAKIKRFLPHYVGAKIVLPYEIVTKTSSDFDVDKLTCYFNSMITDEEGNRPPFAVKYLTDKNSTVEERYKEFTRKEKDDKDVDALLEAITGQSMKSITLDEFRELSIMEQNTTRALNVRLNELHSKALLHPARFESLVKPHESKGIKKIVMGDATISGVYRPTTKMEMLEETESNKLHTSIQWWYNIKKRIAAWKGIQGVAFVASHNTVNSSLQQYPIRISSPLVNMTGNNGKIGGLLFFEGQKLDEGATYTSGFIKDHDGLETTDNYGQFLVSYVDSVKDEFIFNSNVLPELFPIASFLNKWGAESGVGLEQIFTMFSNPLVKEFIESRIDSNSKVLLYNQYTSKSEYDFEKGRTVPSKWFKNNVGYQTDIIDRILERYSKKSGMPKDHTKLVYYLVDEYLKSNNAEKKDMLLGQIRNRIVTSGYKYLTTEEIANADKDPKIMVQVLDNFLMYELFSRKGTRLNGKLRMYASSGFPKSTDGIDAKLNRQEVVMEDGFFNVDDINSHIENTNVRGATDAYTETSDMWSWSNLMKKYPKVYEAFNDYFISVYANSQLKSEDIEKILTQARGNFLSFIFSFNGGHNPMDVRDEYERMFMGKNSIPQRLIKLKGRISNELFDILKSAITEYDNTSNKTRENDYITTFNKKYGLNEEDTFVSIFEELLKSKDTEVSSFANDFFKFAVYQNGVNNSAISFFRIVPNSVFMPMMDKILDDNDFNNDNIRLYFESFVHQFYRNNVNNTKVVPRVKYTIRDISKDLSIPGKSKAAKSMYISARMYTNTKEEYKSNKKSKERNPYELILLKKIQDAPSGPGYQAAIYRPVSKLGDGMRLQEFYPTVTGETIASILPSNNPMEFVKEPENEEKSETRKYTPVPVRSLKDNQVFVFGSNTEGRHGRGGALDAKTKFGAKQHTPAGIQGKSYAIVTKNLTKGVVYLGKKYDKTGEKSVSLDFIGKQLQDLMLYAKTNPGKEFLVTKLGSSLAGYSVEEIKSLFIKLRGVIPNNVILPKEYEVRDDVDKKSNNIETKRYQLEDVEEYDTPNEDLDNSMKDYLKSINVQYKAVESLQKVTGSKNPAIAVANITKMTLDVIEGKRGRNTLPEEAAHFYIGLLDENDGFYQKMFNDITNYSIYSRTVEKYKDIKGYSDKDIREEAMAKLIADRMINGIPSSDLSDRQKKQTDNWMIKLWAHIRRIFEASKYDPYSKAAYEIFMGAAEGHRLAKTEGNNMPISPKTIDVNRIYDSIKKGLEEDDDFDIDELRQKEMMSYIQSIDPEGFKTARGTDLVVSPSGVKGKYADIYIAFKALFAKLSGIIVKQSRVSDQELESMASDIHINISNDKEEMDPLTEWNNLSMTPHGIYKFDYKRNLDEAKRSYDSYVEKFGEDNITMLSTSDSNYKAKIAIKKPRITNETEIIAKEDIARENVQQMQKAPVGYNGDLLLANFDNYFPDLGYLEESEKINMLKSIELGESELICEF